jgi:hypothetical protein
MEIAAPSSDILRRETFRGDRPIIAASKFLPCRGLQFVQRTRLDTFSALGGANVGEDRAEINSHHATALVFTMRGHEMRWLPEQVQS